MPGFFSTGALGTMMELKRAEAYWNRQSADRTRCDWKKQFQEFQWSILLKPHNATNGMQHKFSGEHEWKRSAGLLLEPCKWIRASPAYILQENKHPAPWNVEFASSSFPVKKIPKEYHVNGQIEHSECTLTGRCDALRLWLRQHLQGRANKIAKAAINLHTQDLCLLFLNETFKINFSQTCCRYKFILVSKRSFQMRRETGWVNSMIYLCLLPRKALSGGNSHIKPKNAAGSSCFLWNTPGEAIWKENTWTLCFFHFGFLSPA